MGIAGSGRRLCAILGFALAVGGLGAPSAGRAATYNLAGDWSDTSNPNGPWTYREGVNALPHVDEWERGLGQGINGQPAWAHSETANNKLPVWFKSNGLESPLVGGGPDASPIDWLAGDVVVHPTDEGSGVGNGLANVLWTSPGAGFIIVNGGVWIGRELGRAIDWSLLLNDAVIAHGTVASGDPYDRDDPFNLRQGALGGPGSLSNLLVSTGDTLELRFAKVSTYADFVGVNLHIVLRPEPHISEPGSFLLVLPGLAAFLARPRARVRQRRMTQGTAATGNSAITAALVGDAANPPTRGQR